MRTMESILYETRNNILTSMGVVLPNPTWEWESILGEMYNREPEIEEEPIHITMKTVYEVEEPKRGCLLRKHEANTVYEIDAKE